MPCMPHLFPMQGDVLSLPVIIQDLVPPGRAVVPHHLALVERHVVLPVDGHAPAHCTTAMRDAAAWKGGRGEGGEGRMRSLRMLERGGGGEEGGRQERGEGRKRPCRML